MARAATTLTALAGGLHGSLLRPGDPGYAAIRKPFIGTFDEVLPMAVVRCTAVEDVVESLAFARTEEIPIALRSGGHSLAERSTTNGLLIDLGPLDSVRLDGDVATVGPGLRLGSLAERLAGAGRTVPCGWCPSVAVAGAVLGGGYGVLGRLYGLGCDHLLAARVALADGRLVVVVSGPPPDGRAGLRLSKSEFFDGTLPQAAVAVLVGQFALDRVRGQFRDLEFIPWGGAIGRVAATATAFVHRDARFMLKHTVQVGHRATDERRRPRTAGSPRRGPPHIPGDRVGSTPTTPIRRYRPGILPTTARTSTG